MEALRIAESLKLNDWSIGAGFVRNLVWDKLHDYPEFTPVNDIDLIYFDETNITKEQDLSIEERLKLISDLPWSVKNQARMHIRNHDLPYCSTEDAMSHWVELETAIGAKLSSYGEIELIAPFGVERLFANTITLNSKRMKPKEFKQRVAGKRWLEIWPKLEGIMVNEI
ncbi:nucleotidyltransferase family protein [Hahella ganghwensis]|uniref:nucleotidyltransferase family protein n=1 Tax=Hahella ganghwensis TaxID=286420 RepID=UPI000369E949|nr:nucleotidyltransferase family protein [Hahella ganghwensis]